MGRLWGLGRVLGAAAVQLLLSGWLWGLTPPLVPGAVALLGGRSGPDTGAALGFAGGLCLLLMGAGPPALPLVTLLGAASGFLPGGVLSRLPLLGLYALALALVHSLTGVPLSAAGWLALREWGLMAAFLPLLAVLMGRKERRTGERRKRTWKTVGFGPRP